MKEGISVQAGPLSLRCFVDGGVGLIGDEIQQGERVLGQPSIGLEPYRGSNGDSPTPNIQLALTPKGCDSTPTASGESGNVQDRVPAFHYSQRICPL